MFTALKPFFAILNVEGHIIILANILANSATAGKTIIGLIALGLGLEHAIHWTDYSSFWF